MFTPRENKNSFIAHLQGTRQFPQCFACNNICIETISIYVCQERSEGTVCQLAQGPKCVEAKPCTAPSAAPGPCHILEVESAFIKKYETCMNPIIRVQLAEPSGDRSGLQCPFFGRKTRERER